MDAVNLFGLYEKALPAYLSWEEKLSFAKYAGYDFVEMSTDESDERLERLYRKEAQDELISAIQKTGVPVLTMCLSGNRRYPIGSREKNIRETGVDLIKRAINLSVAVGIRVIQLAGYDEYYNESDESTRAFFAESLRDCVDSAARYGVMLAIETMDTELMGSISNIMSYIKEIGSPWLSVYPDIGNLSSRKVDIEADFKAGCGHIAAIHLKDTRENEFRRVGFGEGIVDFTGFFRLIKAIGYKGPFVVEMWSDDNLNSIPDVKRAREFLLSKQAEAALAEAQEA